MIYTKRNIPNTMTQMTGLNRSKLEMKLMLKSTDVVCGIWNSELVYLRNSELVYLKEFENF